MSEIYIVGIQHRDYEGPSKLERVLEVLDPDVILVEGSKSKDDVQDIYLRGVERILAKMRPVIPEAVRDYILRDQFTVQFESEVSQRFAQNSGVIFDYLDDNFLLVDEELVREAVRIAAMGWMDLSPLQAYVQFRSPQIEMRRAYQDALIYLGKDWEAGLLDSLKNEPDPYKAAKEDTVNHPNLALVARLARHPDNEGNQDEKMELRLRQYAEQYPNQRIVAVVGLDHMLENSAQNTFYSRVKDLDPGRIVLHDVEPQLEEIPPIPLKRRVSRGVRRLLAHGK